jgi:hypothetical protein
MAGSFILRRKFIHGKSNPYDAPRSRHWPTSSRSNNVIVAFLALHRGREIEILTAIRNEIDKGLMDYQKNTAPAAPQVQQLANRQHHNRKKRRH